MKELLDKRGKELNEIRARGEQSLTRNENNAVRNNTAWNRNTTARNNDSEETSAMKLYSSRVNNAAPEKDKDKQDQ